MIEHDDSHDVISGHDPSAQHLDSVLHAVLDPAADPIHDSSADPSAVADVAGYDGLTRGDLPADAGGLQVVDTGGGTIELGEPTLGSTGDQPDSVVAYTGSGAEVYSDLDGDGHVDQILRVGLDGHLAAWSLDAGSEWQLTSTGAMDAGGHIELWPADTHIGGGAQSDAAPSDIAQSDPAPSDPAADAAPVVTIPGAAGTEFTGPATYDANGDGVADTVVVHSQDGSVTSATDSDGDGVADQITVAAADGQVTVSQNDGDGNWHVVATGTVNSDGSISLDGDATASVPAPSVDQSATPSAEPPATPSAEPPATPSAEPTTSDANDHVAPSFGAVPGDHIAVYSGGQFVDAGTPTYDMNHDGTPETSIVERDGVSYQYSDTDGDGRADEMLTVTMSDHSATISVDHGNGWRLAATGHVAAGGDFVPTADPTTSTDAPHNPVATGPAQPAAQHPAPPDIELTEPGGTTIDLGAPDQDMNGDGVPESVAVHTADGHLLIVSDTDGEGTGDHVIDIDPETGAARWLTITDGEWVEVEHGHVSDDGALVVDGKGGDAPHGLTSDEELTVTVNGRSFPAGPATIDTDGDGVPDTVAVPGVGGSTQLYQDSNGDGVADRAWTVNADGSRGETYVIDKHGDWVPQSSDAGSADHSGAGLLSRYETGG